MHCGDGGAAAVLVWYHGGHGGAAAVMAVPRRSIADWPNPRWHCGSFEHVQSFRRVTARVRDLKFFRGATAINTGTTSEPRRSWRCHCGLCRTTTVVGTRLRCEGGRRSAVLTIVRGSTAINDGTTAEPRRSWRCHCGLCRTSTAMALRLRCDGGITAFFRILINPRAYHGSL